MKFLCVAFFTATFFPFFAFANPATIKINNSDFHTPSLEYYINNTSLKQALALGINHTFVVIITAKNESNEFKPKFDTVQFFNNKGTPIGRNAVSNSTGAVELLTNEFKFTFEDFGITNLEEVAGVQIKFLSAKGNTGNTITVNNVAIFLKRQDGESCIIADPITIITPENKPPTIREKQTERRLVSQVGGDEGGGGSTSVGPIAPGTMGNHNATGTSAWEGVDSAKISDDVKAAVNVSASTRISNYLQATNFDFSQIPDTATINGIIVSLERMQGVSGTVKDAEVRLVKNYVVGETEKKEDDNWPTLDVVKTYGSSSDLWGTTWTVNDIKNIGFGFALSVIGSGDLPTIAHVDYISITVHYTTTGSSVYDSFMDLIQTIAKKIACRVAPRANCGK